MGSNRFPKASQRNRFELMSADESAVLMHDLTFEECEARVMTGRAVRRIDPETRALVGYKVSQSKELPAIGPGKTIELHQPSESVITEEEMDLLASKRRSHTYGMNPVQRARRVLAGLEAFDEMEHVKTKLDAFTPAQVIAAREADREAYRVLRILKSRAADRRARGLGTFRHSKASELARQQGRVLE